MVFLDEPSSGMDPVSRRFMWDLIISRRISLTSPPHLPQVSRRFMWDLITAERQRRSIVLTTHSMEECEALCSRVGIIAMGRLQCLGGTQHLKSKFGGGYTIELSVGEPNPNPN